MGSEAASCWQREQRREKDPVHELNAATPGLGVLWDADATNAVSGEAVVGNLAEPPHSQG